MPQFNRRELYVRAREYGFNRDTFEKVLRLRTILDFLNTHRFLKNISFSGIVNTMKIDLSIFMSCKAGFLLTISLFGQQEVIY